MTLWLSSHSSLHSTDVLSSVGVWDSIIRSSSFFTLNRRSIVRGCLKQHYPVVVLFYTQPTFYRPCVFETTLFSPYYFRHSTDALSSVIVWGIWAPFRDLLVLPRLFLHSTVVLSSVNLWRTNLNWKPVSFQLYYFDLDTRVLTFLLDVFKSLRSILPRNQPLMSGSPNADASSSWKKELNVRHKRPAIDLDNLEYVYLFCFRLFLIILFLSDEERERAEKRLKANRLAVEKSR